MGHHDEIPEAVRDYLGHDKVALFGTGGRPVPPAPPDSPPRRHGELAVREALAAIGESHQPGDRPAARPAPPTTAGRMRQMSERALMEASMKKLGRVAPREHSNPIARAVIVPVWRVLPWSVRKTMLKTASGVKGWYRGNP